MARRHLGQIHPLEPDLRPPSAFGPPHAPEPQREAHVLEGGEVGHELSELKDEPESLAPELTAPGLAQIIDAPPLVVNLSCVGAQDPREAMQQGRLP